MKRTIRLTESELHTLIEETVKKVLNEKYNPNDIYIVFDGTSYYVVYGCDVEDEINTNDVEVVDGPFKEWDETVNNKLDDLNDEALGVKYDRRKFYY